MSLDIKLNRIDRIYRPGDMVSGSVLVSSQGPFQHQGIVLNVEGTVALQISARKMGLFDALYSTIKPLKVLQIKVTIAGPGKLPDGDSELPFEFELKPVEGQEIVETYHGIYVKAMYFITADIARPMLAKNLKKLTEFIVECPGNRTAPAKEPVEFRITPETLENVSQKQLGKIAWFDIRGTLDSCVCDVNKPLTGTMVVKESKDYIKSVELQLVRVETCGMGDTVGSEATEVQRIQICDGDVARDVVIPLYMVFPRLFTSATLESRNFKVEFEVNLVALFSSGYMVTENFPLQLYRR